MQVGQHTLKATVDHEEICNSPQALHVVPGAPCLSASGLDESALTSAAAGQTCTARLSACNAFGARVSSGGAPLTAAYGSSGASSTTPLLSPFRQIGLEVPHGKGPAGCGVSIALNA